MEKNRIYNLYPNFIGHMNNWIKEFPRIKKMNFDWIYINPFHLRGESNSPYSVKDYYQYNGEFIGEYKDAEDNIKKGDTLLKKVCDEAEKRDMKIMMDLVINHTAIDSNLVTLHPDWYIKNEDGSIFNPFCMDGDKKVVWVDLASIDNLNAEKKDEIWTYWVDLILHYCSLGVRGFRCDAVTMVPDALWIHIIKNVKSKYPDAFFLGETLGCEFDKTINTLKNGFDMIMTAFKWWDYNGLWFVEQYNQTALYGKTMSFPENHDTLRCAYEELGNANKVLMKYELAAYISSGVALTYGFEYGYRRKIDVTKTDETWNEIKRFDISDYIAKVNKQKEKYEILNQDTKLEKIHFGNANLIGLIKDNGDMKALIIFNIGNEVINEFINPNVILNKVDVMDISISKKEKNLSNGVTTELLPGDVKVFLGK